MYIGLEPIHLDGTNLKMPQIKHQYIAVIFLQNKFYWFGQIIPALTFSPWHY